MVWSRRLDESATYGRNQWKGGLREEDRCKVQQTTVVLKTLRTQRLGMSRSAMTNRSAGPRKNRYRSKNIAGSSCVSGIAIIKNNHETITARMPRMHSTVIVKTCTRSVMSALCSVEHW